MTNSLILDFPRYIKDLLFQHDCVILPGMGGFVANYKPAEFDHARNIASPPSKHILFNRNLVYNDGLLYAHVSEVTGYGYKDVQEKAEAFIDGIRRDTGKGVKFEIEGLGFFYLDKEKQIQFTEESGNNFLLESYGLPFLPYKELERPKISSYRSALHETDSLARQRRIRRWTYGTAAACLLAAMIIIPIQTGYFNRAGIDIPLKDSFQKDRTSQIEIPEQANQAESNPGAARTNILFPEPEYNIIVGSFKDFGNARLLRNQLTESGYESRILSMENGMFRVTAGTYFNPQEAGTELAFVLTEYDAAWILSI